MESTGFTSPSDDVKFQKSAPVRLNSQPLLAKFSAAAVVPAEAHARTLPETSYEWTPTVAAPIVTTFDELASVPICTPLPRLLQVEALLHETSIGLIVPASVEGCVVCSVSVAERIVAPKGI